MALIHEYKVTMTCDGCSGAVERVLKRHKSIDKVEISLPDQKVLVTTAMSSDEVLEIIKKTGKAVEFVQTLK